LCPLSVSIDPALTQLHPLSLHDALPILGNRPQFIKSAPLSLALREAGIEEVSLHTGQHYDPELSQVFFDELALTEPAYRLDARSDRKSTRLNSSHGSISYAVLCLKKKRK